MNALAKKTAIRRELLRRSAQSRLIDFIYYVKLDYRANWHHTFIADKLDSFLSSDQGRLMLFVPPQHGKSDIASRTLPAYIMGRNPDMKVAACSYSIDLARSFSRAVQSYMGSEEYAEVFPGVQIGQPASTDLFHVKGKAGTYKAVGVLGGLTGHTVDLAIIDDPVKDALEASSQTYRERVWEWYLNVLETRLHNRSKVILIMCMTGDTLVLMADGTEKYIKDIKIGDVIATYDNGKIATSKVVNWKNQGIDNVFEMRMKSGILVKANERHPFLVYNNNILEWKRLKEIKPGDMIVRIAQNGEHTQARNAILMDAKNPQNAKDIATLTTTKSAGRKERDLPQTMPSQGEMHDCGIDTGLALTNITPCSKCKGVGVQFAVTSHLKKTQGHIGQGSYASTTATKLEKSEDCSATTAISWLGTEKQNKTSSGLLSTYEITLDSVVEIIAAGREDVFDIQVDRTENFIANGLVSHNTRWHEDDLAGRLLERQPDKWEVIKIPAIREAGGLPDDPREIGEPLWPERHSLEKLNSLRALSERTFTSLYQQNPTVQEGDKIKRAWFQYCHEKELHERLAWDLWIDGAYTKNTANDPTGLLVTAYDERTKTMYIRHAHSAYMELPDLLGFLPEYCDLHGVNNRGRIYIEPKASGKSLRQMLKDRTDLNAVEIKTPLVSEGKEARAQVASPKVEAGRVVLVRGTWNDKFLEEVGGFPNAKHDEMIDLLGYSTNHYFDLRRSGGVKRRN